MQGCDVLTRVDLRYSGKGANRTRRIALSYPRFMDRLQPVHSPPSGIARGSSDGSQRGWAHRQPRRAVIVTTMSSAEPTRRDFLYLATGAVGAVGAVAAAIPLIAQMNPDASTIAAGAPVEVDLAPIADGQIVK